MRSGTERGGRRGKHDPADEKRTETRRFLDGRVRCLMVAALGLALAGCDNFRFTADLASDAPSNTNITSVEVNLLGLDFRREDGADRTLEFTDPEVVDLLNLETGDPMRLFTDEDLPAGHYIGVRLLFDRDEDPNQVTTGTGE